MKLYNIIFSIIITFLVSCSDSINKTKEAVSNTDSTMKQSIIPYKSKFEKTIEGKRTSLFFLKNNNGMTAAITNYGGRVVSLLVPAKDGKMVDVVVGFGSVEDYERSTEPYFGASIGRYGNRIAKGTFSLDGKRYTLFKNNGPNTLHGGKKGFQAVVWDAVQPNDSTLQLSYVSKDGEEGFPGDLTVKIIYTLTSDNALQISYDANTNKNTVINLTNHSFFNLNGEGSGTILNHTLQIFADQYTPVDSTLIPTGKLEPVKNTPFDFNSLTSIGSRINMKDEQLTNGKGYDHNFVLKDGQSKSLRHAAIVRGDLTGIEVDVYTKEPGLQFYSGNFMQSNNTFKGGTKDDFRTAFCLETQHYPDSPNQPDFPSTVLSPGKVYNTETVYKFSTIK